LDILFCEASSHLCITRGWETSFLEFS
jgi:hypothetical protein